MKQVKTFLEGRKTYIVATFMVLASLTQLLAGDISITEFVSTENFELFLVGLGFATVRAGVKKAEK